MRGRKTRFQKTVEVKRDPEDVPRHAVMKIPAGGREAIEKAIDFKVGPSCNWTYGRTHSFRHSYVVLWGDHLEEKDFRLLSEACNEIERECSNMGSYDSAKGARSMAGKALHPVKIGKWGSEE